MIKKIEAWLRKIVAEVVAEAIKAERATRDDARQILAEALSGFRAEVARIHSEELAAFEKIHEDAIVEKNLVISELHAKAAELKEALHAFTQWTADEATKAADKIHQEAAKL